jgi:tetratricopeptide (TPR) repeat protein
LGKPDAALKLFAAAEQADPSFADGAFNLGTVLLSLDRLDEASAVLQRLLARHPGHQGAINNLGAALIKAGRPSEAADHYRAALAAGGAAGTLGINLASALELANQLEAAQEALETVAEGVAKGEALPAQLLLVRGRVARRQGNLDQAAADIAAALSQPLEPSDRIEALFVQGLILDQQNKPAEAFAAFRDGNAVVASQPASQRHDGAAYLRDLEGAAQWFTPHRLTTLADRAKRRSEGENVVFFVGFPRSGTTLMEQVLEAHPRLVTTMESSPLEVVHRRLGRAYPEVVERLDGQAGERLRDAFFEAAEAVVGPLGEQILIDKMPLNITLLGLVQALFPRARVLVALRDPRDAVLSCFMQNFRLNPAMANFLDIEQAARTYATVMGMWQAQQPHLGLRCHSYRYEDLVEQFTPTVEAVLDFLGVGWDPAVEQYREKAQARQIVTPSYRDVTAPLFTRAMGRWQAYRAQLAPILPVLEPVVEAFGYPPTADQA